MDADRIHVQCREAAFECDGHECIQRAWHVDARYQRDGGVPCQCLVNQ